MIDVSLDPLQQMVQRVLDSQRETREDVREIKARLGRLESEVASLQRTAFAHGEHWLSNRVDRPEDEARCLR
jgi:peptidoglycan hydrolase CwlO-like protein